MSEVDNENKFFEIQLVLFNIGKEEFGVEISDVKEIIKLEQSTEIPKADSYIEGIINLRGEIVVIVDLPQKLGFTATNKDSSARVIVSEISGKSIGFHVDKCNEVFKITGDKIQEAPKMIADKINSKYLQGVVTHNDRLITLIDLSKVFENTKIEQAIINSTQSSDKKLLLIVEDSQMMRATIKNYIDKSKFTILEAGDGDKATELIDSHKPDIVLLDINLPKKNGVDILKETKEKYPNTTVIMETSVYDEDTKKKCMELGATDYLKKPLNKKQLVSLIEAN